LKSRAKSGRGIQTNPRAAESWHFRVLAPIAAGSSSDPDPGGFGPPA
jgi:hypothetical protein